MLWKSNETSLLLTASFLCAGVTRLSSNLEEMTGKGANIFFRLCWLIVDPVLVTVRLFSSTSFRLNIFPLQQNRDPSKSFTTEALNVSSSCRLSWFSLSSSSSQPAMRTMSSLPGLRGSAGSLPWPPSYGFLWVLCTRCGCSLAHSCRWCIFTGSTHVHVLCCLCVNVIVTFLLQKLKQSFKPYALNETNEPKMPYYERGGRLGDPAVAVICSSISLSEKPPVETNFWYSTLHPNVNRMFTKPPTLADFQ